MPVLLSYFDARIGPRPFISVPRNLDDELKDDTSKLMDFLHEPGSIFVQDYQEKSMKSINMVFTIPSEWARGKQEHVQLSIFTTEEVPQVDRYRHCLEEARNKMVNTPDIYKGFYQGKDADSLPSNALDSAPGDDIMAGIDRHYNMLVEIMENLEDQVRVEVPRNHPILVSLEKIRCGRSLPVPPGVLAEIADLVEFNWEEGKVFMVYRKVGKSVKLDLIPCKDGRVLHLRIKVGKLSPEIIKMTADTVKMPLLFTSGICMEKAGTTCTYEAFFTLDGRGKEDIARIGAELRSNPIVESCEIKILS